MTLCFPKMMGFKSQSFKEEFKYHKITSSSLFTEPLLYSFLKVTKKIGEGAKKDEIKKSGALTDKSLISAGIWGGTEARAERSFSEKKDSSS